MRPSRPRPQRGRDPEYLAFVRRATAAAAADEPDLSVDDDRAALRATMAEVPREPVASVDDVELVGGDGVARRGRLYRPRVTEPGLEAHCLVYVHGGGWQIGDVESWDPVVRTLADACRIAFLSVESRQAPEHPYPAAVDDLVAAVRTLRTGGVAPWVDPGSVGVAGDSSGGNVAAAAALRLRDEGDPALALQILVYPVVDVVEVPADPPDPDGIDWQRPPADAVVAPYLAGADPAQPYLSPLRAPDLTLLPPTVVVTAEYDRLAAQARAYAARLGDAGVRVELVEGRGLDHGFVAWTRFVRRPREAVGETGAAVRRVLLAPATEGAPPA